MYFILSGIHSYISTMNYSFEDPALIYVGDPLCSWCWGMANELDKLKKAYSWPFHVVVGGLRPGTVDPLDDSERSFIRHHWEEVNKRTGQPFKFDLIDQKVSFIYDTEIPCRAVVAVRNMDQSKTLPFFKSVQESFYAHNNDTNHLEFYEPLVEQQNLDFDQFRKLFASEEMRKETNDDFMWCRNVGANSFPTVILHQQNQLSALAIGYATFDDMKARVELVQGKGI